MTRAELADDSWKHFQIMEGEGGPRIYSYASCRYCPHTTSRSDHPTDLVFIIEQAQEHTRREHPEKLDEQAHGEEEPVLTLKVYRTGRAEVTQDVGRPSADLAALLRRIADGFENDPQRLL